MTVLRPTLRTRGRSISRQQRKQKVVGLSVSFSLTISKLTRLFSDQRLTNHSNCNNYFKARKSGKFKVSFSHEDLPLNPLTLPFYFAYKEKGRKEIERNLSCNVDAVWRTDLSNSCLSCHQSTTRLS